mmetsp:Transcript_48792/g.87875  ORF Transcript_48792/g.87875 Transcript_48792/m.87875 type:complete len:280 (-) Transcript_48792:35-874(-)
MGQDEEPAPADLTAEQMARTMQEEAPQGDGIVAMQQETTRQRKKLNLVSKQSLIEGPTSRKWGPQNNTWGGPASPYFPTDRQLQREAGSLHFEHELLNEEFQADAAARTAMALDEHKRLAFEQGGFAGGPGPLETKAEVQNYMTWARAQRAQGKGNAGSSERHELTQLSPGPSFHSSTSSAFGKKKKYEPAKVVGPDGKVRLKGVRSTSDISRYCKDVDPYSKKNWAVREAFKNMRKEEHSRAASTTWGALRSWYSTDKTLDQWYSTAKGSNQFPKSSS